MSVVAFIGFGEAASAIVSGWTSGQHNVVAYDIKLGHASTQTEILQRCEQHEVGVCFSASEAVAQADLVFSTVTADQALDAAQATADALTENSYYLDLNSCAPSTKVAASELVAKVGCHYIDVAVMAPVHPALNLVPLLISGAGAQAVLSRLEALPMKPQWVSAEVGAASSVKMLRSVMVKGMEALTAECSLAAVAAGVESDVFASLNRSHSGGDWEAQAAYNFERSVVHGKRRAAEMREVAKTLASLNLPSDMVEATVAWQSRLGELDIPATELPATELPETDLPMEQGVKPIANLVLSKLTDKDA